MNEPALTFAGRAAVLISLTATPLLCYLARNHYSPLRLETLSALAVLVCMSMLAAAAARNRIVFFAIVAGCAAFDCAALPVALLAGHATISPLQGFAVCLVLSGAAMAVFQEKFLRVIVGVSLAVYVGSLLTNLTASESAVAAAPASKASPPHILYIVLDEHLGVGAFPRDIPACASAARAVESTFLSHQFTLHPNAYSNYAITVDSLPSVFNRTLLPHSHKMVEQAHTGSRSYTLTANRLCSDLRLRGMEVAVCQHRSLDLRAGAGAAHLDYEDVLGNLEEVDGSWIDKVRWIIGGYQASDPTLQRINAFFPFHFGSHTTGPLAIRGIWPGKVLSQIQNAKRPTLFLVHLMMPHGPYLYRKDGGIRPMAEWSGDRADRRLQPAAYREHYTRYCEQVEYLSIETATLFDRLRDAGSWDAMSVVVHGDHGSRIREVLPGKADHASAEYFDYGSTEPAIRDLLDRFSTLMAEKRPQQMAARIAPEKESLLRILERDFYRSKSVPAGMDDVYLNDDKGLPRAIPIRSYWR